MEGLAGSQWWQPDEVVVDAVRRGRVDWSTLEEHEQCWVVASLSEDGLGTAPIAEMCSCSQRQVKRLRARILTQQMRIAIRAVRQRDEAREAAATARRRLAVVTLERDELRAVFSWKGR